MHDQVLAAAAEEGVSVSAWMTAAARRALLVRYGLRGTSDVVDAHLVVIAAKKASTVLTSDIDDLHSLSGELPAPVSLRRV